MECYFVSYSKERSVKFWNEKKATPLLERQSFDHTFELSDDFEGIYRQSEYVEADLSIADELQKIFPDLKAALLQAPFDPNWGRSLAVVNALDTESPNLDKLLVCKKYFSDNQYDRLLALKINRDATAQNIISKKREAQKLSPVKISKQELVQRIASLDLDLNGVATEYDISYTLLEYFVNYYKLDLQPQTDLPTKDEIIRLYNLISSKALNEISHLNYAEVEELERFLQELRPVVVDLKNNPDSEFISIGDGIDPESFETFLDKRAKDILTTIEPYLPSNWTITK